MIGRKVDKLGSEVSRASLFLSRNFSSAITVERSLEKKSLDLKRKIVEARGRTLRTIGSRDKDSQISGGIGGALGLLGLGFTRKLFRPRVPKTPGSLLRLQRGATVSRASQLGGLGRLARPLAIVGTGLDFIGRKAEGQNNVQAGVGAAGGLAGSLAGAKYGAILGTAVGGPIGTAVGGVGGAIIGGLAGGRLADLFTGANRRRQFEEERTITRTQRTSFADSLDDFDRVLDKLEGLAPALVLRRDDDESPGSSRPRPIIPKPKTPFFQRPAVQATGITLAVATAIALAVLTRGRSRGSEKVILELIKKKPASFKKLPLKEQLQVLFKDAKKEELLTRMSKSPFLTKRGNIVPGQKGAPSLSKKGLEVRNLSKAERLELKANKLNIELQKKLKKIQEGTISDAELLKLENDPNAGAIINEITRSTGKGVTLDPSAFSREALTKVEAATAFLKKMGPTSKNTGSFSRMLGIERSKLVEQIRSLNELMKISPKESTKIRLNDAKKALKIIDDALKKFAPRQIIKKNLKKNKITGDTDLSSNLEPPNSTDIALAPSGNIFLINQSQGDSIEVVSDDTPATMTTNGISAYSAAAKYAEFTASLTA